MEAELGDGRAEQLAYRAITDDVVWGDQSEFAIREGHTRGSRRSRSYKGCGGVAEASVALAVLAVGVAVLRVTLFIRCVQIARSRQVDGNLGHFAHSRREGIYQQSRDEWEELAHLEHHRSNKWWAFATAGLA
jgi:hypothetical protein